MVACVEYDEFKIEYYMFQSFRRAFSVSVQVSDNLLTPICQLITDYILPSHFYDRLHCPSASTKVVLNPLIANNYNM